MRPYRTAGRPLYRYPGQTTQKTRFPSAKSDDLLTTETLGELGELLNAENDDTVSRIETQPYLESPTFKRGKRSLDVRKTLQTGEQTLVEVRRDTALQDPKVIEDLRHIEEVARQQGYGFEVRKRSDALAKPRFDTLLFLFRFKRLPISDDALQALAVLARDVKAAGLQRWLAEAAHRRVPAAVIYYGLATKRLGYDLDTPLLPDGLVWEIKR